MPNYYKTDVPCDGVEIIFDQGYATTGEVPVGSPAILEVPEYIMGSNNIQVFAEIGSPLTWTLLTEADYTEISSTTITVGAIVAGNVKVIRKPGLLVDGVHYTRVNSQIMQFEEEFVGQLYGGSPLINNLTKIYTHNPAKSKLNPAKIIDMESNVVVADVPIWDPARGHHSHNAIHVAKLQRGDPLDPNGEDPALYNMVVNDTDVSDKAWNSQEVGITWFDKSTLGYLPYYDENVYSNLDDRLFYWGKLAPWASINLYEWTESTVPPAEYDAISAVQEGDVTIDEKIRVTGQAKGTPYTRSRNNFTFDVTIEASGYQTFTVPDLYGTVSESDATGLVNNFVQQFTAIGSGSPSVDEVFTLDQPYANGQVPTRIQVTQNGIPVAITEISSTQFSVSVATATDDIIQATITAPNYTTGITVDGTLYNVVINGSVAQNYGQLLGRLTDDLSLSGAIVELDGNDIKITSPTTGSSSTVLITEPVNLPLFGSIGPYGGSPLLTANDAVDGIDSEVIPVVGYTFVPGDEVIVSSAGTLPAPLEAGGTYTVDLSASPMSFQLKDSTGTEVEFTDTGTGIHTIADSTFPTTWDKEIDVHDLIDVVYQQGLQDTTDSINLPLYGSPAVPKFADGDSVDVYINEVFQETVTVASSTVTLTNYTFQSQDTIRIIRQAHDIIAADEEFDPDTTDDGTIHIQYKNLYNYTEVTTIDENGIDEIKTYYFWVGNKSVRTIPNSALSLREAKEQLEEIPTPYIIFQNLEPQQIATPTSPGLPSRYNRMILRGHAGLINADNRYVLRFTRDLTLRDTLESPENAPMQKNVHTEWELFRENQQSHPRRDLWDKVTESIVGYLLADSTVRIPSRERELYDDVHGTDTRYGLGDGQIFIDGDLAQATILADLNNPDNDFYPTDIDLFFQNYNFDTAENSIALMDRIYNNFAYDHVNRMFHAVLLDAFSKKDKYPEIFKTSMISLHGIRILETAGLYDD